MTDKIIYFSPTTKQQNTSGILGKRHQKVQNTQMLCTTINGKIIGLTGGNNPEKNRIQLKHICAWYKLVRINYLIS